MKSAYELVALLAVCGPVGADGVELAFGREAGERVRKRFRTECRVAMKSARLAVNGQRRNTRALGLPDNMEVAFGYSLEVEDRYDEVVASRALDVSRTYDVLQGWIDKSWADEVRGESEWTGRTVRFRWDGSAERYEPTVTGGLNRGDQQRLERLAGDVDFCRLLPGEPVERGDSWRLDEDDLAAVLVPGFDVQLAREPGQSSAPPELVQVVDALLDGAVATASFDGVEQRDGASLAVVRVQAFLDGKTSVPRQELEVHFGTRLNKARLVGSLAFELEAVCLWDLDAGAFHSLEVAGEGSLETDMSVTMMGGKATVVGGARFLLRLDGRAESETR